MVVNFGRIGLNQLLSMDVYWLLREFILLDECEPVSTENSQSQNHCQFYDALKTEPYKKKHDSVRAFYRLLLLFLSHSTQKPVCIPTSSMPANGELKTTLRTELVSCKYSRSQNI